MTTTNKDFAVKQGIRVATGVTFPDNSVQTTAYTGQGATLTVGTTFPESPSNGQLFLYTVTERIYYYLNSTWTPIASYLDAQNPIDGNGIVYPDLYALLDGGSPSTTYSLVIDGGSANAQF